MKNKKTISLVVLGVSSFLFATAALATTVPTKPTPTVFKTAGNLPSTMKAPPVKAPATPVKKPAAAPTTKAPVAPAPLSDAAIKTANTAIENDDFAAFQKAVVGDAKSEAMTKDDFDKLSAKVKAQKDLTTSIDTADYTLFHASVATNPKALAITKEQFDTMIAGIRIMQDAGLVPPRQTTSAPQQ